MEECLVHLPHWSHTLQSSIDTNVFKPKCTQTDRKKLQQQKNTDYFSFRSTKAATLDFERIKRCLIADLWTQQFIHWSVCDNGLAFICVRVYIWLVLVFFFVSIFVCHYSFCYNSEKKRKFTILLPFLLE